MSNHLAGKMNMEKKLPAPHPLAKSLKGKRLILGSKSPRRAQLLGELGLDYEIRPSDAEEEIDLTLAPEDVPSSLALQKANALRSTLSSDELLLTADTIVIHNGKILGKPRDISTAQAYLKELSGSWHTVITGFALTSIDKQISHSVQSEIRFLPLTEEEIEYYTTYYEVTDKAGAYGVQDWIGLMGVAELKGSYHNVMGLPTASIYHLIKKFCEENEQL